MKTPQQTARLSSNPHIAKPTAADYGYGPGGLSNPVSSTFRAPLPAILTHPPGGDHMALLQPPPPSSSYPNGAQLIIDPLTGAPLPVPGSASAAASASSGGMGRYTLSLRDARRILLERGALSYRHLPPTREMWRADPMAHSHAHFDIQGEEDAGRAKALDIIEEASSEEDDGDAQGGRGAAHRDPASGSAAGGTRRARGRAGGGGPQDWGPLQRGIVQTAREISEWVDSLVLPDKARERDRSKGDGVGEQAPAEALGSLRLDDDRAGAGAQSKLREATQRAEGAAAQGPGREQGRAAADAQEAEAAAAAAEAREEEEQGYGDTTITSRTYEAQPTLVERFGGQPESGSVEQATSTDGPDERTESPPGSPVVSQQRGASANAGQCISSKATNDGNRGGDHPQAGASAAPSAPPPPALVLGVEVERTAAYMCFLVEDAFDRLMLHCLARIYGCSSFSCDERWRVRVRVRQRHHQNYQRQREQREQVLGACAGTSAGDPGRDELQEPEEDEEEEEEEELVRCTYLFNPRRSAGGSGSVRRALLAGRNGGGSSGGGGKRKKAGGGRRRRARAGSNASSVVSLATTAATTDTEAEADTEMSRSSSFAVEESGFLPPPAAADGRAGLAPAGSGSEAGAGGGPGGWSALASLGHRRRPGLGQGQRNRSVDTMATTDGYSEVEVEYEELGESSDEEEESDAGEEEGEEA